MADEPVVTTPTSTPATTTPPTPAAVPPVTVSIPAEQLQALLAQSARIAALEAENRQRETAAAEERTRLLVEKGDAVKAVQTLREQKDAEIKAANDQRLVSEEGAKRFALDGELARVLASKKLVEHAVPQLSELWRKEFQAIPEGGSIAVRTPTFQTVDQFVTERLTRPEFAHFMQPNNPGGGTATTTGAHHAAPTGGQPQATEMPKNLGEAIRLQYAQDHGPAGVDDAATNLTKTFGLKRKSG